MYIHDERTDEFPFDYTNKPKSDMAVRYEEL